jgi:hypothetical protein
MTEAAMTGTAGASRILAWTRSVLVIATGPAAACPPRWPWPGSKWLAAAAGPDYIDDMYIADAARPR